MFILKHMSIINFISDLVLGPCIRNIRTNDKVIYLTFDDGPNSYCTPKVLDLLKKYNAKASFFVIGNNIKNNVHILKRIKGEGHAIGNHSIDHNTKTFFKGKSAVEKWINQGEEAILKYTGNSSIGFRPPAGIRTPELRLIMKQKNERPIIWQHRFFDTVFTFNDKSWQKKIKKIKSGDIILLHDTHFEPTSFVNSLERFIKKLIGNGFKVCAIEKSIPLKKPSTE